MNMSDLKINLTNFLSGDLKAETEAMLGTMGYVKKVETPAVPEVPATPKAPEANSDAADSGMEKIKADAKAAANPEAEAETARIAGLTDLCILADAETKLADFIQNKTSVTDARKSIMDAKAQRDEQANINSTTDPLSTGEVNPMIAEAKRRAGQE